MKGGMSLMESLRWKPKNQIEREKKEKEVRNAEKRQEEEAKRQEKETRQATAAEYKAIDILRMKVDDYGNYILLDSETKERKQIPDLGKDPMTGKLIVRDIYTPTVDRYLPVINQEKVGSRSIQRYYRKEDVKDALDDLKHISIEPTRPFKWYGGRHRIRKHHSMKYRTRKNRSTKRRSQKNRR
jgi:signal recognition particle GTPase